MKKELLPHSVEKLKIRLVKNLTGITQLVSRGASWCGVLKLMVFTSVPSLSWAVMWFHFALGSGHENALTRSPTLVGVIGQGPQLLGIGAGATLPTGCSPSPHTEHSRGPKRSPFLSHAASSESDFSSKASYWLG